MEAPVRLRVSLFLIVFSISTRVYVQHVHRGRIRGTLAELIRKILSCDTVCRLLVNFSDTQ